MGTFALTLAAAADRLAENDARPCAIVRGRPCGAMQRGTAAPTARPTATRGRDTRRRSPYASRRRARTAA